MFLWSPGLEGCNGQGAAPPWFYTHRVQSLGSSDISQTSPRCCPTLPLPVKLRLLHLRMQNAVPKHVKVGHEKTKTANQLQCHPPQCSQSCAASHMGSSHDGLINPLGGRGQRMSVSRLAVISPRQALCLCAHLPSPLPPPMPSVSCPALWLKSLLSFRLSCSPGLPGKCAPSQRSQRRGSKCIIVGLEYKTDTDRMISLTFIGTIKTYERTQDS